MDSVKFLSVKILYQCKMIFLKIQDSLFLELPQFTGHGAAIHAQIICQFLPAQ